LPGWSGSRLTPAGRLATRGPFRTIHLSETFPLTRLRGTARFAATLRVPAGRQWFGNGGEATFWQIAPGMVRPSGDRGNMTGWQGSGTFCQGAVMGRQKQARGAGVGRKGPGIHEQREQTFRPAGRAAPEEH